LTTACGRFCPGIPNPGIERGDGKGFAVAVGFPGKEVSGLAPRQGNPGRLEEWIAAVRATDLLQRHLVVAL